MINLLSKPAEEIGPPDIADLIASALPEGEQVEFKRSLSTAKTRRDPWEHGKEPGDKAKIEILEEVTAFANAYGGVLILGLDESSTKPAGRIGGSSGSSLHGLGGALQARFSRLRGTANRRVGNLRRSHDGR